MRDGAPEGGRPREPHADDTAARRARPADAEAAATRPAGSPGAGAGRSRPPGADDASARRTRLMGALVAVVAERGFPRTTIGAVAARAGLPAAAFHDHFGDLEDCFLAAYERGTRALLARAETAYRAEASWPAAVRAGLRAALELAAAEPALARMCVIDASTAGPRVHRARQAFLTRFRSFLGGPGIPRIPGEIRNAIIGGVYTMVYNHVESDRTAELPDLADPLADFLLAFYRAGGSPAPSWAAASSRPRGSSAK